MTNFSIANALPMPHTKQEIFKSWVNEHADVLYYYALRHGFDDHNGKDIVQETFLSAWRGMDSFREDASVRSWLFTILRNKITDHFRKAANKINIESLQAEFNDQQFFDENDHWKEGMYPDQWSVNFSDPTDVNDFRRVFNGCTGKLKQIQNAVFVMKYVDDLESDKICKELGISSSNYWVILHRAKVQLRACLEKSWLKK